MKLNLAIVLSVLTLSIGTVIGYQIHQPKPENAKKCSSNYEYINKEIGCNTSLHISKALYTTLKNRLMDYIEREKSKDPSLNVSIYFRDLNAGPTFGINQDIKFIPASLLKVPLLLTYLSIEEDSPEIMKQTIVYKKFTTDVTQKLTEIEELKEGNGYQVGELLKRMIVYSDNASYDTLRAYLEAKYANEDLFVKTLTDLGLVFPMSGAESAFSTKSYASLFRQLYNASYLSAEQSEKALSLLSQSAFADGLTGGIAKQIKVAHKFGRRTNLPNNGVQLHDCGIVYYPNNPYLLCIMTRGQSEAKLKNIIKFISKSVYDEVNSRKL